MEQEPQTGAGSKKDLSPQAISIQSNRTCILWVENASLEIGHPFSEHYLLCEDKLSTQYILD